MKKGKTTGTDSAPKKAAKRAGRKVRRIAREMVKVIVPSPVPDPAKTDVWVGAPVRRPRAIDLPNPPDELILDNLAGIANRVNEWLAHGPGFNLENRLRARLSTPGLMDWVRARMES